MGLSAARGTDGQRRRRGSPVRCRGAVARGGNRGPARPARLMSTTENPNADPNGVLPEQPPVGLEAAAAAARRYLLSIQREDGHWCGELEGDTILESEYMLTMHFLGRSGETRF